MENVSSTRDYSKRVINALSKYWLLLVTILVFVVISAIQPGFAKFSNIMNILIDTTITAIAGIGITCIMSTGELDFSCGTELSMGTVLMGVILGRTAVENYVVAVILTLLIMACFGLFNAFLHIKIGIPAFIATFGSSYLLQGIGKIVMGSSSMYNLQAWPDSFTYLGQGRIFDKIPVAVIVLIVVSVLAYFYTEKSKWGKYLYAVGNNPKACEYVGIKSSTQKTIGFVLCAVLCGFAGVMESSMTNTASIYLGASSLTNALTVMMIGATFLKPGIFNVPGTVLGALLVSMVDNGLIILGLQSYTRDFIKGIILLLSILVVMYLKHRETKHN